MWRRVPRTVRHVASICIALYLTSASLPALAQGGVHLVEPGDTLTGIAARYDTTVDELRERNGLDGDLLRVGQRLALPAPPGWRRVGADADATWSSLAASLALPEELLRGANPGVVGPGGQTVRVPPDVGRLATPLEDEDLIAFAARLGVAPGAIAARNGLEAPYAIEAGVPLLLPVDAVAVDAAAVAATPVGPTSVTPTAAARTNGAATSAAASPTTATSHVALRADAFALLRTALVGIRLEPPDDGFAWPLSGARRITSRFGWRAISVAGNRYHAGLDLGAATGTPVLASREGTVVRSGWIGAYGNVIYLRHADGFETRYAHLARIDVAQGEAVQRGQRIGAVGSTGASTGPHLHLEVRLDGRALDPLDVLPGADGATSGTN